MTEEDIYLKVADAVSRQMDADRLAYITKTRTELVSTLRAESGEPRRRIGRGVAEGIEAAMDRRGMKMFPHLHEIGSHEAVRIFRRGTFAEKVLRAILHPGATTGEELAKLISGAKGYNKILKVAAGSD